MVITGSAGLRGSKVVELKSITDAALKLAAKQNHTVRHFSAFASCQLFSFVLA